MRRQVVKQIDGMVVALKQEKADDIKMKSSLSGLYNIDDPPGFLLPKQPHWAIERHFEGMGSAGGGD